MNVRRDFLLKEYRKLGYLAILYIFYKSSGAIQSQLMKLHFESAGADLLYVRLELAFGLAGDLAADAAEILGLSTSVILTPRRGSLPGKITNTRHHITSVPMARSLEPVN